MAGGESYEGITVPEGDPGALEASAGRLVATAGMLDAVSGSLRGVLGGLAWFGPASAAHSGLTNAQSLMATTASGSLIQHAAVINDYALILESAQRQAKRAIERAKDADGRIREAKEDIREAIDEQAAANARIIAAQAAQARFVTSVIDVALGDAAAAAAADMAAAEEADARRDLQAADRKEKTIAAQPGDRGGISISGEQFGKQEGMLRRIGEDPELLKHQPSDEIRHAMKDTAGHDMPRHNFDPPRPDGWYYGTHAELRLLIDDPKVPVGVTRNPCPESCDPGIQRLAASVKEDIVVQSPDGPTLYRSDGEVVRNPSPEQFSGVNSRWPGVLWGAGGTAAGAGLSAAGP